MAIVVIALAAMPGTRAKLQFSHPWLHVIRGCLIGASTQFGFYSIAVVPLATAAALMLTAPIFAAVFNIFLHREVIGPRRIIAAVVGFVGALIVLRPTISSVDVGMVAALISSVLFGLTLSLSRNVTRVDGAASTYVSSVFFTALMAMPLAFLDFQLPSAWVIWGAVGVVVVTSFIRNIGDILAYHWAEASALITLTYTRLVLIGVMAYFLFDEVPDLPTLIGAAIIIGSTLYIAQRQAALKRKVAQQAG
jgi:drug/metabolite transporter (DMT)-like permease